MCRQFTLVNELHDGRAAQPEDLGSLLRRDLLVAGEDADRRPVTQGLNDLLQDRVKLLGEFDAIVLTGAAQEEGRLGGCAVTRLVDLDEAQHPGQLISVARRRVTISAAVVLMTPPDFLVDHHHNTVAKVTKSRPGETSSRWLRQFVLNIGGAIQTRPMDDAVDPPSSRVTETWLSVDVFADTTTSR